MHPFDEATFAAHVRRLGHEERRAFVADVWRARGYDVQVRGRIVVTDDGARRRRLAIAERDGEAADEVVDPAALAEVVAYGLPVGVARSCCERHLGAAPAALGPPPVMRARRRAGTVRRALPAAFAVLAVVLLLGMVGLDAGPAADGAEERPGDGRDLGNVTEQSVPPGPEYEVTAGANDTGGAFVDRAQQPTAPS